MLHRTAWLLTALLAGPPAVAQDIKDAPEYEIKAAFLYNFATFVEWPDKAFAGPAAPFKVGVLGKSPFGKAIDDIFEDRTAHGRPLAVERSDDPEELSDCQIVFFSFAERGRLASLLKATRGKPVLLVGEADGLAARGAAVNFFIENDLVRFEINPDAARRAGVTLRANLLRVGKIVRDGN